MNKKTRLFPDIKPGRDGYGQVVSKWFARYRKKHGVDDESKKVFHSFRHTVINHLKQKEVAKEIVAAIVGHEDGSVTFGRYGKDFTPDVLKEYVEILQFDINIKRTYKQLVWLGVSYRTQEAVAIMMGFRKDRILFGYAYDIAISDIRKYNVGTHEILFMFKFNRSTPKL